MHLRLSRTHVWPSSELEEMVLVCGELLTQGQWRGYASCAPSGRGDPVALSASITSMPRRSRTNVTAIPCRSSVNVWTRP